MRKNENIYLFSVAIMLLVFVSLSLYRFSELEGLWHNEASAAKPTGKPRNINSEQMRTLMNQGRLSDKDAKFYTTSPMTENPPAAMPDIQ